MLSDTRERGLYQQCCETQKGMFHIGSLPSVFVEESLWAQNHMYSMWNQPNWQHCLTMNKFLVSENAKASHIRTHSGFPFALQAQSSCCRQKSCLEQNKVTYL